MCQYSRSMRGQLLHFIHIGNLALSGAGMFCIEATHVEPRGVLRPAVWDCGTTQPRRRCNRSGGRTPTLEIAVAMQLAHAGRKASSHVPWKGGQQIPLSRAVG